MGPGQELLVFTGSYIRLCSSAAAENSTNTFHHDSVLSLRFRTSSHEPEPEQKGGSRSWQIKHMQTHKTLLILWRPPNPYPASHHALKTIEHFRSRNRTELLYSILQTWNIVIPFSELGAESFGSNRLRRNQKLTKSPLHTIQASWWHNSLHPLCYLLLESYLVRFRFKLWDVLTLTTLFMHPNKLTPLDRP